MYQCYQTLCDDRLKREGVRLHGHDPLQSKFENLREDVRLDESNRLSLEGQQVHL